MHTSDKLATCVSLANNRRLIHVYPRGQRITHLDTRIIPAGSDLQSDDFIWRIFQNNGLALDEFSLWRAREDLIIASEGGISADPRMATRFMPVPPSAPGSRSLWRVVDQRRGYLLSPREAVE